MWNSLERSFPARIIRFAFGRTTRLSRCHRSQRFSALTTGCSATIWLQQVLQRGSEEQGLNAALAAIRDALRKRADVSETTWVQRPGGLTLALTRAQAQQVLQDGR